MVVNKTFGKIFCMGSIIMDVSIKCKEFPLVGETVYTPYFYEISPGGKVEIKQLLLLVWAEMLGY